MHQRFLHRGHDRDRRRLRGGWGQSSSREHLERHLGAGIHQRPERLDAGNRHLRGDLRHRGAGIRRRLDAGLQHLDAEHPDAANRVAVPGGEECCSGSGAGPCPVRLRTGCYPVAESRDAGPYPVRLQTGCCPVAVHPDEDRPVLLACPTRLLRAQRRQRMPALRGPLQLRVLRVLQQQRAQQELPEQVLPERVLPPQGPEPEQRARREPERVLPLQASWPVPEREPGVSPVLRTLRPLGPLLRQQRQAWRHPLRGQHEVSVQPGVQWLMRAT